MALARLRKGLHPNPSCSHLRVAQSTACKLSLDWVAADLEIPQAKRSAALDPDEVFSLALDLRQPWRKLVSQALELTADAGFQAQEVDEVLEDLRRAHTRALVGRSA